MNLTNIIESLQSLSEEVSSLKGEINLLEKQFVSSQKRLVELKELQEINKKAVELLTFVSQSTREKIQELFERVVSQALQYVYQSNDYKFELDFDRRGSLPKLTFLLKTPDMQEKHDILNTRAGGAKDIVALALRFVLLEISKNPGFVFLDEPFKRLDNEETIQQAINFVKEMQSKTGRQMFIITHKKEVVEAVSNPIIFKKCSQNNEHKRKMNISNNNQKTVCKETKRKRGRPRKESK